MTTRLPALDGLRGLAALIVVFNHFWATFIPHAVFGAVGLSGYEFQDSLSRSPLFVFYNGTFAVFIFFVLSGFVIAGSAASTHVPLLVLFGRRYLRLAVPALASTLLVFVLLQIYPDITQHTANEFENGWLKPYYTHPSGLFSAIIDGIFNPFKFGTSFSNFVLWTMRYELFGSVAIYLIYAISPNKYLKYIFLLIFFVLIFQNEFLAGFMGFAGGALLYGAWRSGYFSLNRPLTGALLWLLGLLLGGLPLQPVDGTWWEPVSVAIARFSSPREFILSMAALATMAGCLCWSASRSLLSHPSCRFLGRISFGLYLVHWPLLATVGLDVYWKVSPSGFSFWLFGLAYFLLVIGVAYIVTIVLDEPLVSTLQRVRFMPRHKTFFAFHLAMLTVFLFWISLRLGPDIGSLVVWGFAYAGFVFLISIPLFGFLKQKTQVG